MEWSGGAGMSGGGRKEGRNGENWKTRGGLEGFRGGDDLLGCVCSVSSPVT